MMEKIRKVSNIGKNSRTFIVDTWTTEDGAKLCRHTLYGVCYFDWCNRHYTIEPIGGSARILSEAEFNELISIHSDPLYKELI